MAKSWRLMWTCSLIRSGAWCRSLIWNQIDVLWSLEHSDPVVSNNKSINSLANMLILLKSLCFIVTPVMILWEATASTELTAVMLQYVCNHLCSLAVKLLFYFSLKLYFPLFVYYLQH